MESEFFITVYAAITDGAISRKFFLKFSTNTVGTPNTGPREKTRHMLQTRVVVEAGDEKMMTTLLDAPLR
jgi:hypothetical protein